MSAFKLFTVKDKKPNSADEEEVTALIVSFTVAVGQSAKVYKNKVQPDMQQCHVETLFEELRLSWPQIMKLITQTWNDVKRGTIFLQTTKQTHHCLRWFQGRGRWWVTAELWPELLSRWTLWGRTQYKLDQSGVNGMQWEGRATLKAEEDTVFCGISGDLDRGVWGSSKMRA